MVFENISESILFYFSMHCNFLGKSFIKKVEVSSNFSVQNVGGFIVLILYSIIYAILFTFIFFLNKVTRKVFFR